MKKLLKLLIIICFMVTLCACSSKKEYKMTEITINELINNILTDEEETFFVATLSDRSIAFKRDLETLVNTNGVNVYYLDIDKTDSINFIYLNMLLNDYATNGRYFVVNNGSIENYGTYTSYKKIKDVVDKYDFTDNFEFISDEDKLPSLEEAKKLYDEGKISSSLQELTKAWTLPEAKEFYNTHKYYELLKYWEAYSYKDSSNKTFTYMTMALYVDNDSFSIATKDGKSSEEFEKIDIDETKIKHYYIKDDIIYVGSNVTNKFDKYYEIKEIGANYIILYDYKLKKEITFSERLD